MLWLAASEAKSCLPPTVRGHGTAQLQDAVPGVRRAQSDVQTPTPLPDRCVGREWIGAAMSGWHARLGGRREGRGGVSDGRRGGTDRIQIEFLMPLVDLVARPGEVFTVCGVPDLALILWRRSVRLAFLLWCCRSHQGRNKNAGQKKLLDAGSDDVSSWELVGLLLERDFCSGCDYVVPWNVTDLPSVIANNFFFYGDGTAKLVDDLCATHVRRASRSGPVPDKTTSGFVVTRTHVSRDRRQRMNCRGESNANLRDLLAKHFTDLGFASVRLGWHNAAGQ